MFYYYLSSAIYYLYPTVLARWILCCTILLNADACVIFPCSVQSYKDVSVSPTGGVITNDLQTAVYMSIHMS